MTHFIANALEGEALIYYYLYLPYMSLPVLFVRVMLDRGVVMASHLHFRHIKSQRQRQTVSHLCYEHCFISMGCWSSFLYLHLNYDCKNWFPLNHLAAIFL